MASLALVPRHPDVVEGEWDAQGRLLGAYGRPVLEPGGGIDAEATVHHLRAIGANTYAYLVGPALPGRGTPSRQQWEDLPAFAEAAGRAGIGVYVYLVPPTEAPDPSRYGPYGWDYVRWAREVGVIASTRPSIRGIIIDDVATNVPGRSRYSMAFTPETIEAMRTAARDAAGWVRVLGVLYYQDLFGARSVDPVYTASLDGVVFPYLGRATSTTRANTRNASHVESQVRAVGSVVGCASGSFCTQVSFPPKAPGSETDAAAHLGSCEPGADCRLDLTVSDNRWSTPRSGVVVEVLVDGEVRWRSRAGTAAATELDVDVRHLTDGRGGVVGLRITPAPGSSTERVTARVHRLTLTGAGASSGTAEWSGAARVEVAADKQLVVMGYASPLGSENRRGVDATYVEDVLDRLAASWDSAGVDGSLLYLVPEAPGAPESRVRDAVRRGHERLAVPSAPGSEPPAG